MQANYPKASISNGPVQAVLYLPDAKNGYYRASRFDWSGVIPCLAYKGHTYFGIWFSHYDPMLADAIAGPVEEFRSTDGALDYGQAKPGESVRQDRSRRAAQGRRLPLQVHVHLSAGGWRQVDGSRRPPPGIFPATAPLAHRHRLRL